MKICTLLLSLDQKLIQEYLNNHQEKSYTYEEYMNKPDTTLNDDVIIYHVPISREKRMVLYKYLISLNYHVKIVLMHTPLPILLTYAADKKTILDAYKYLATPRIGVDCDVYQILDPYLFLKPLTDFKTILNFAKENGVVKTIEKFVSTDYIHELKDINKPHETPYHLESIEEHIDMCIQNSQSDEMLITALLHDLGKSVCKNVGSYKGHDKLSSIYAFKFFNEVLNTTVDSETIVEIINQHMNAHRGISIKVQEENHLDDYLLVLIESFKQIDEKSRITNM